MRTLFILLNLLDFWYHTGNGDARATAGNLTVLIVVFIALSGTKRVKDKKYTAAYIVFTCLCLAAGVVRAVWLYPFWIWTSLSKIMNLWGIGILLITLIGNRKEILAQKHKAGRLYICWLLFTVLAVLSRNKLIWPIWYFAVFSLFYIVSFDKKKWERTINGMVDGTIITFFVLQIYAYGFRPWDVVRYPGAYINCNMLALHYVIIFCMLLIKLHYLEQKGANKWLKLLVTFLAGGLISFQVVTICRTALVTSAALIFVFGIVVVGYLWKKKLAGIFLRGCLLAASILISFPLVFLTIRYLPAVLHHPVWYDGEYSVNKVHSFDPVDSDKYVDWDEFMQAAFGRYIKQKVGNLNETDKELFTVDELQTFFGGREYVYSRYLGNLNWTGHTEAEGYFPLTEEHHTWHAQNHWLQAAFYLGIPAGVIFFIMTVIISIRSLLIAVKKKEETFAIVPLMITVVFMVFGLAELVWGFGQLILVLFFLVQHPQFYKGAVCDEKEEVFDSVQ